MKDVHREAQHVLIESLADALIVAAAKVGAHVVLLAYVISVVTTAGSVLWEDSDATPLSGSIDIPAGESIIVPTNAFGHVVTADDKGLSLFLEGGGTFSGHVTYMVVANYS